MSAHTAEEIQAKIDDLENIREAIRETVSTLSRYKSVVMYPDAPYNQNPDGIIAEGKNAMKTEYR